LVDRDDFRIVSRGRATWLECASLARWPWLVHAFSTRLLGPERLFGQFGRDEFSLAGLRQTHSADVLRVSRRADGALEYRSPGCPTILGSSPPVTSHLTRVCGPASRRADKGSMPAGDALLTDQPGILPSVRAADCMPILIADTRRRAIAAVHAGWRGALQRIVEKAVGEMRRAFDSDPADLVAAIGPSIRACCYEVGPEVVDAFRGRFRASEDFFQGRTADEAARVRALGSLPFLSTRPPGPDPEDAPSVHLDLIAVARHELLTAGLRPSGIHIAPFCTACRTDLFYSFRKEGSPAGRMTAVIGIRELSP
jgi:YfiH family protein